MNDKTDGQNAPMFKVHLVVGLVKGKGKPTRGYYRQIELPFVPQVGMKFEQGVSTTMWETRDGELNPSIEEVIYDLDEEVIVCLFTVSEELHASCWKELQNPTNDNYKCAELKYFRHR